MRLASAWTMMLAVLALLTGGWGGDLAVREAVPAHAAGHHHHREPAAPCGACTLASCCIAVDLPAPAAPLARPLAIEAPVSLALRIDGGEGVTVPPALGPPRGA